MKFTYTKMNLIQKWHCRKLWNSCELKWIIKRHCLKSWNSCTLNTNHTHTHVGKQVLEVKGAGNDK